MEEQLLLKAAEQGLWAALFIFLFMYQLKESKRQQDESRAREEKLTVFIEDMARNFEVLAKQYERLAEDVQEIKCTIRK